MGTADVKDTARIGEYLRSKDAFNTIGDKARFLWSYKPVDEQQRVYELIAIRAENGQVGLSCDIIQEAHKTMSSQTGRPEILVTMTPLAADMWKQLTGINKGRAIAVVVDDKVYSYPVVQEQIADGQSTISGNFTQQEADDFVSVLQAGIMPVRLRILSEELVPGSR